MSQTPTSQEQLKDQEEPNFQRALQFSLAQSQGSSAQVGTSIVPGAVASSSSQSSASSTSSSVSGSNLGLRQAVQEARARRQQLK